MGIILGLVVIDEKGVKKIVEYCKEAINQEALILLIKLEGSLVDPNGAILSEANKITTKQ